MLRSCCNISFLNLKRLHWLTGFVCLREAGKQQPPAQAVGKGWLSKSPGQGAEPGGHLQTAEPSEVLLVSFFHQSESRVFPVERLAPAPTSWRSLMWPFSPFIPSQAASQSSPGPSAGAAQGWEPCRRHHARGVCGGIGHCHCPGTGRGQLPLAADTEGSGCWWLAVPWSCCTPLQVPPLPCVLLHPQLQGYRGDGTDGAGDNGNGGDRWQINS